MYKIKRNGITYEVTQGPNGPIYNPPLPEDWVAKGKKNLKEMVDECSPPGTQGDDTSFHRGRGSILNQFDGDEVYADYAAKKARSAGIQVGTNDVYMGQLGAPDNPRAWFKPSEGRAELKKRAEKDGLGIDMPGLYVEPKPYDPSKQKKVPLNPKIANNLVKQYRAAGKADGMSDKELKKHVVKKHGRNA